MTKRGYKFAILITVLLAGGLAAACSPVRMLNALTPASEYLLTADVAYGPDPRHRLDLYTPRSAAPTNGFPVVVFFHPDYPKDSQPIACAGRTLPRSFLGAAISDPLVNPERNTRQLADKLAAAGVPVTLRFYDRVDHITLIGAFARPLRWMAPVLEDVAGFVKGAP